MSGLIDAWQGALAAEQEAAFGYTVLGPRLSAPDQARALADQAAHQALVDVITQAVQSAGAVPVGAKADYPSIYPDQTRTQALATAIRLEAGCASAWRYLFSVAADDVRLDPKAATRRQAQVALTASAVRGTRWRSISGAVALTAAFPGIS